MNDYKVYEGWGADEPECPECGGPRGYLGTLGGADWYQCRDCGATWTEEENS